MYVRTQHLLHAHTRRGDPRLLISISLWLMGNLTFWLLAFEYSRPALPGPGQVRHVPTL